MRRIAICFMALGLMAAPIVASAQEDDVRSLTTFDPLVTVVESFSGGGDGLGLAVENPEPNAPIASSLQFLVNLSWGSAFVTTDVTPHGLSAGSNELTDLSEIFDDNLALLPPLHPWGTNGGAADLAPLLPGWTAYGEEGRIEGPVLVAEAPTVVWAMELDEPWDETCSENRSVGRAWMGESLTSSDGPLTEELLEQAYPDNSHAVLADGNNTRYIELRCWQGSEPRVIANRVNADLGRIRAFGPLNVVALVNEGHVLFFMAERILGIDETQIDPFFYAGPPGDAVRSFEPVAQVPAIVPHVYDTYSTRITLAMDIPEGEEATDRDEVEVHDLRYRPGQARAVTAGTGGCPPPVGTIFFADWARAAFQSGFWSRDASVVTFGSFISDEPAEFEGTTPDGRSWTMTVDLDTGDVRVVTEECEGTGTASGEPFGTDSEATDGEIVSGGTDDADVDVDVEPVFSDDSGTPWGLIGLAAVLVAGLAFGVGRSRTRMRDCKPEEEAWEAAIEAFDDAKRTHEHWIGEDQHWGGLYAELKAKLDRRLPEPNRELGYPDTPDGQAAYEADLSEWQQTEADARQAEEDTDHFRERAEVARRNREESKSALDAAADLVWKAQIALQNCRGSAPPLPTGVDTGGGHPQPTEPPPQSEDGCEKGTTRWVSDTTKGAQSFVIPDSIQLRLPTSDWSAFAPGGVADPTALYALTEADALALVQDLDNQRVKTVRPQAKIVLVRVTVSCEKEQECVARGTWSDTGTTRTSERREPAGTVDVDVPTRLDSRGLAGFLSGEVGAVGAATATGEAAARGTLRSALEPHMEAQQAYQNFTCG